MRRRPDVVHIQGHRGARDKFPENSLQGFEYALAAGVQILELDILFMRDDQIVVTHNPTLHPDTTRNEAGEWIDAQGNIMIRDLDLKELQKYDVGRIRAGSSTLERFQEQRGLDNVAIPTLKDIFELLSQNENELVWLNIEVKSDPLEPEKTAPLRQLVEQLYTQICFFNMERRVSIQSFDWNAFLKFQKGAPEIATSYLSSIGSAERSAGNNIYPGSP